MLGTENSPVLLTVTLILLLLIIILIIMSGDHVKPVRCFYAINTCQGKLFHWLIQH